MLEMSYPRDSKNVSHIDERLVQTGLEKILIQVWVGGQGGLSNNLVNPWAKQYSIEILAYTLYLWFGGKSRVCASLHKFIVLNLCITLSRLRGCHIHSNSANVKDQSQVKRLTSCYNLLVRNVDTMLQFLLKMRLQTLGLTLLLSLVCSRV